VLFRSVAGACSTVRRRQRTRLRAEVGFGAKKFNVRPVKPEERQQEEQPRQIWRERSRQNPWEGATADPEWRRRRPVLNFEQAELRKPKDVPKKDLFEVPARGKLERNPKATCRTTKGDFRIEILVDKMPITASNFIDLIERGFYNGLHFHRVSPSYVVEFGCKYSRDPHAPQAGGGTAAPNSKFAVLDGTERIVKRIGGHIPDEFVKDAELSNVSGALAMCNRGEPDTGSTQFFININSNPRLDWDNEGLPGKHPVFAKVIDGMPVIFKISHEKPDHRKCPIKPVAMIDITIDTDEKGNLL